MTVAVAVIVVVLPCVRVARLQRAFSFFSFFFCLAVLALVACTGHFLAAAPAGAGSATRQAIASTMSRAGRTRAAAL